MEKGQYILVDGLIQAGAPIPVSIYVYTKSQIMAKYKAGFSSYTPFATDAASALQGAFPTSYLYHEHPTVYTGCQL